MYHYKRALLIAVISVLVGLTPIQQVTAGQCKIVPSGCALKFDLKVRKGKDKCKKFFISTFTGPSGYQVIPHPSVHGWKLLIDHKKRRDYWKSKECKSITISIGVKTF